MFGSCGLPASELPLFALSGTGGFSLTGFDSEVKPEKVSCDFFFGDPFCLGRRAELFFVGLNLPRLKEMLAGSVEMSPKFGFADAVGAGGGGGMKTGGGEGGAAGAD
jgi:hypothetical protein